MSRKKTEAGKRARRMARRIIGSPPPSRVIPSKLVGKKPKHKKPLNDAESLD